MTITTNILNTGCTVSLAKVATEALDVTKFALVDQQVTPDGNTRESFYQMLEGSEEHPLTLRAGYYKNPKLNAGIGGVNTSMKLTTYVQKADVDDVLWTLPLTVTLAVSAPGGSPMPDAENLISLLDLVLTAYTPFVAGVQDQAIIDEIKFGIMNRIMSHGSTPAA